MLNHCFHRIIPNPLSPTPHLTCDSRAVPYNIVTAMVHRLIAEDCFAAGIAEVPIKVTRVASPLSLPMQPSSPRNPIALALWANAILLGGILIALLSHANVPSFLPAAFGQNQGAIAGGAGVYVMPGQLAERQWGCYLLDVDAKTLVAYQYMPGDRKLQFVAARSYDHDRKLHDMSTWPPTEDIRKLVEKEKQGFRNREEVAPPQNPELPKP